MVHWTMDFLFIFLYVLSLSRRKRIHLEPKVIAHFYAELQARSRSERSWLMKVTSAIGFYRNTDLDPHPIDKQSDPL